MSSNHKDQSESGTDAGSTLQTVPRWHALSRLWRAKLIYAVALAAFAILALFAHLDPYFRWDLEISEHFNWQTFTPPGLLPFMLLVSTFGNRWIPFALTGATALIFLWWRKRSEAAGLVFSAGGSALLNSLFKLLIARPRPPHDLIHVYRDLVTQSFPSGHVTFYVTYFGFLFFTAYVLLPHGSIARRLALTLTALPVLLVGLSRIYLGAHWPSDTIGAYLWSGVWLAFSLWMYHRWKKRRTFHRGQLPAAEAGAD